MRGSLVILAVGGLAGAASLASAQAVTIDHQAMGCVVADHFPALQARLEPADQVTRARAYFRAGASPAWYYVEMKPHEGQYRGVLPKPKKSLKRIDYYLEVTDRAAGVARTQEYSAEVLPDLGTCNGAMMAAGAVGTGSITVAAVGSAPAVPVGFSSTGIAGAAGGGGFGTTAAVVGGVGAAAAATVVAVKAGGDDEGGGPPCTGDSLTVLDRSANSLTLRWSFATPSPEDCYTVDYLAEVGECMLPPHNNILVVRGTTATVTGLSPGVLYSIHVHPLTGCPPGRTAPGSTNPVSVRTLPAGSGTQPVGPSDYSRCCG
jgi:hypothetical protein